MALVNRNFSDIVTFTRASAALYTNSAGVLTTAAINAPRIDFSAAGVALGLLIEEQRTNLALWNRDLTNAAWVKSNITAAKDQTGADGVVNSASSITATAANGTVLQTITSASAERVQSAYVKRISGVGTVEMTQDNGATWTAITVTASWAVVEVPKATVANPVIGFRIATSGDAIAVDYAQNEVGAFRTSAIGTTTAAVTRAADVATISTLAPWFNAVEGTIYCEVASADTTGSKAFAYYFDDTTSNNSIYSDVSSGNRRGVVFSGGAAQAAIAMGAITSGVAAKTAFAYKANDFAGSLGGGAEVTDVSGSVPIVTRLALGNNFSSSASINGWLRKIIYYPAKKNTQTLTA